MSMCLVSSRVSLVDHSTEFTMAWTKVSASWNNTMKIDLYIVLHVWIQIIYFSLFARTQSEDFMSVKSAEPGGRHNMVA